MYNKCLPLTLCQFIFSILNFDLSSFCRRRKARGLVASGQQQQPKERAAPVPKGLRCPQTSASQLKVTGQGPKRATRLQQFWLPIAPNFSGRHQEPPDQSFDQLSRHRHRLRQGHSSGRTFLPSRNCSILNYKILVDFEHVSEQNTTHFS